MQRLFIKIFLWFWLAFALVVSATLIPEEFSRNDQVNQRFSALVDQRLIIAGRVAVVVMSGSNPENFVGFRQEMEEGGAPYPFVFDDTGLEITGREVPADAQDIADRVLAPDGPERIITREDDVWVGRTFERGGDSYAVVQQLVRAIDVPPPSIWPLVLRWLVMLSISGIVCYGLARYLVGPLTTLSHATRALAQGQLDVRVADRMGTRRDEIGDLGEDFDYMASRVGDLLDSQRQLLSDISHELRSPLARLSVALGLARQRAGDAATDSLDRIERESENVNALIGELLTLTRLEAPESLPEATKIELDRLVSEVAADGDYEARSRSRSVTVSGQTGITVLGHALLLRRALENVVRNAIRYTPEETQVEISLHSAESQATVTVRDHGPGVPENALLALFEPFYRVSDARERGAGGTGLGLAITDRAVRAHGGEISAHNCADGGLEIEITLPATTATT
jgi:two-component system sensor histidine kinase CpxA